MPEELPKRYDYSTFEKDISLLWESADAFCAVPDGREDRYVIMMPLPNVTGALHMGHAMDNVMQDLLIRRHRMKGDNSLWMPGTDHAGIATQAVVEKRLFELEGISRHDIGRDALTAKIWEWKDEYQQRIVKQQQSMGCSCDWKRQRFTMDAVCTRAVREAFYRLFRDGLIYRGDRLVNWDCQLETAVSDDEVVYEITHGHFWHIMYPVVDPRPGEPKNVTVATTRPETMLGDTAVACHPDPAEALEQQGRLLAERLESAHKKERPQIETAMKEIEIRLEELLPGLLTLKRMAEEGRTVTLPLLNREIPLILDEWAKPELGSGCVKITPAHDANDYDVWSRHRDEIAIVNILRPDGTLNENAGPYRDLDRFEARERILEDLKEQGLIGEIEEREIEIGHSDRSKTPIEPYLSKQWFVRMDDVEGGILCGDGTGKSFRTAGLAQAAIDAVDGKYSSLSGRRLTFHPDHERYSGTYRNWLSEKRDWCISRQLWWGHRIPIWHGGGTHAEIRKLLSLLTDNDAYWLCAYGADSRPIYGSGLEGLNDGEEYTFTVCLRDIEADKKYSALLVNEGLSQDPDVLDTWFSSALWPFSTLGWPHPESAAVEDNQRKLGSENGKADCLQYFYPGSCLVTARDIITLWVARMLMMGLYLLGDVPFTDCFVHANIQDGKGERMSKSKGNGIDPEDIIERYGTDAMRYVLCDMQTGTQDIRLPVQAVSPYTGEPVDLATAEHGRTIFTYICPGSGKEFDVLGTMPELPSAKVVSERFEEGRAFCTKLWNAARFTLMNLGDHRYSPITFAELQTEDRWILSRLSGIIRRISEHLDAYNPSAAIGAVREFFWSEFCDWYLELVKPRLVEEVSGRIARSVMALVLDHVLRLLHPFIPFITETLWQRLGIQCPERGLEKPIPSSTLVITALWPEAEPEWEDRCIEEEFDLVREVVRSMRDLRARYSVSPNKEVAGLIRAEGRNLEVLLGAEEVIVSMARLSSLEISGSVRRPRTAASQVVADAEVYLEGLLDTDKEKLRLEKQREKLIAEAANAGKRLGNRQFLDRAPPAVVEAERKKLVEIQARLALLEKGLKEIS